MIYIIFIIYYFFGISFFIIYDIVKPKNKVVSNNLNEPLL